MIHFMYIHYQSVSFNINPSTLSNSNIAFSIVHSTPTPLSCYSQPTPCPHHLMHGHLPELTPWAPYLPQSIPSSAARVII